MRLNRSGRPLNAPIAAMGSDGSHGMGGPYEPRISPDGKRFSYYFYVQTSFDDLEHSIRWIDTGSYGTWTWADHFTSPATESEYLRGYTQAEWVTDDRLLGTAGMFLNMWTWKLGTGHGYTYQAGQWWFGLQDPVDEWGVEGYHWYNDPALSRDGSKLAMTDGGGGDSQLLIADDRLPYAARRVLQPELVGEQRHAGLRHVRRRAQPRAFRAGGRGTKVRYTLSAAGRVTVTVTTAKGKPVKGAKRTNGKAGANMLRFSGRLGSKQLRPGAYRLVLTPAGGTAASVSFKLLR